MTTWESVSQETPDAGEPHIAPPLCYGGTGQFCDGRLKRAVWGAVRCLLVAGACLAAPSALAKDFVWKTDAANFTDFTSKDNFTVDGSAATEAPGEGDAVLIPGGVTVKLDPATDAASWSVANALLKIAYASASQSKPAKLEITVASGSESLGCQLPSGGYSPDTVSHFVIVKKGAGELRLTNQDLRVALNSKFLVEAGKLTLPQDRTVDSSMYAGTVDIAAGATVQVCNKGNWFYAVSGSGLLTNANATSCHVLISLEAIKTPMRLDVTIGGKISLDLYGPVTFPHARNTYTGGTLKYSSGKAGLLEFYRLGCSTTTPSSMGSLENWNSLTAIDDDECFRYIGTEPENSTRWIRFGHGKTLTIDGGLWGGLTLTGAFQKYGYDDIYNYRIVLTGSNVANRCVFESSSLVDAWTMPATGDHPYSLYFIKRGTGVWRLTDADRNFSDGIAVEEGVLETEEINPLGTAGALGYGTNLTHGVGGIWTESQRAPYAISLGGTNSACPGILSYVGKTSVSCTTRPAVVKGYGGLGNDSGYPFSFSGVSAFSNDAPAHVFVLTGTNTDENTVADVTDALAGTGTLSVEKRGTGRWKLTGANLSFGGTLDVREGTLAVANADLAADKVLPHVESVSVRSGATFAAEGAVQLAKLHTDAAGIGTLRGFTFAASGAFAVTGVDAKKREIALGGTFENATGLANLPGWTLSVKAADGKDVSVRYGLSLRDGRLFLRKKGFAVILR